MSTTDMNFNINGDESVSQRLKKVISGSNQLAGSLRNVQRLSAGASAVGGAAGAAAGGGLAGGGLGLMASYVLFDKIFNNMGKFSETFRRADIGLRLAQRNLWKSVDFAKKFMIAKALSNYINAAKGVVGKVGKLSPELKINTAALATSLARLIPVAGMIALGVAAVAGFAALFDKSLAKKMGELTVSANDAMTNTMSGLMYGLKMVAYGIKRGAERITGDTVDLNSKGHAPGMTARDQAKMNTKRNRDEQMAFIDEYIKKETKGWLSISKDVEAVRKEMVDYINKLDEQRMKAIEDLIYLNEKKSWL